MKRIAIVTATDRTLLGETLRRNEALARQGLAFSEGEIRGLQKQLSQSGLVRSRIGRAGSELTEWGRLFLKQQATG